MDVQNILEILQEKACGARQLLGTRNLMIRKGYVKRDLYTAKETYKRDLHKMKETYKGYI